MPWGAIVSAAGSLISSYMSKRSTENMSNTAYQRGVRDMRKAGINPIMAYQQGGASTPSFNFQNPLGDVQEDVTSAKRVKFEKTVADAQRHALEEQADATRRNADATALNALTNKRNADAEIEQKAIQNALFEAERAKAQAETAYINSGRAVRDWDVKLGQQDFERGQFSAEQQKSFERLFSGKEWSFRDVARAITQILMSSGYSARRGFSVGR